jgi:hypothetical protein
MPDMNQAAVQEMTLIDGVTNNVDVQLDNIHKITQAVREFADGVMGPTPPLPPSQPAGNGINAPDTRGSKLLKSTERLSVAVRDLGDQVLRLRRI